MSDPLNMAARRLVTIEGADDFVALCEIDENLAETDRLLREPPAVAERRRLEEEDLEW
jgi:hypothetical protein